MNKKESKKPRQPEAVVLSDLHLGTFGCKAKELLRYLKSIQPKTLILNGDIIDIWQFSKSFFPKSHLKVVRQIMKMMENGTQVKYVIGNHDDSLRRFVGAEIGNLKLVNKVVLKLDGTKSWIFHGDAFDVIMEHSKWLGRLGAFGYGLLTMINKIMNALLMIFGQGKISLSKNLKSMVKAKRKKTTSKFESTVANLGIEKKYQFAICGHIHWPTKKTITNSHGSIVYLNSGDWVENMTALEYHNQDWHLTYFNEEETFDDLETESSSDYLDSSEKALFKVMYQDVISD